MLLMLFSVLLLLALALVVVVLLFSVCLGVVTPVVLDSVSLSVFFADVVLGVCECFFC